MEFWENMAFFMLLYKIFKKEKIYPETQSHTTLHTIGYGKIYFYLEFVSLFSFI